MSRLGEQELYRRQFYALRDQRTRHAAAVVLRLLGRRMAPETVVDVGCGTGTWLAVAKEEWGSRVTGIDGPWVDTDLLEIDSSEFVASDLRNIENHSGMWDLAICLEVAEHVEDALGRHLVDWLCAHSQTILFSAAIPGQRGTNHINERWQSYWVKLFLANGFSPLDHIRPSIWDDDNIPFFYRQNMMLYSRDENIGDTTKPSQQGIYDIVHPTLWEKARFGPMGVTSAVRALGTSIAASIRRRGQQIRKQ